MDTLCLPIRPPTRLAPPSWEPVTLAEAKKQCEIAAEVTYHDAQLSALITAARQKLEQDTSLVCADGQYLWRLDAWPSGPVLSIGYIWPVRQVVKVEYLAADGTTWLEMPAAEYALVTEAVRPYIRLAHGSQWPSLPDALDPIRITLRAGYVSAADVPQLAKQAILLLVSYWWQVRLGISGTPVSDMERAYSTLTNSLAKAAYP